MKRILLIIGIVALLCTSVFAGGANVYESTVVSAENTWTDPLYIKAGSRVDVSIYNLNSVTATIKLQRKFPEESSWGHEVDSWDVTTSSVDIEHTTRSGAGDAYYRIGCPTGGYTSGNCTVRIGQYRY